MRVVVQRCRKASCKVAGEVIGKIEEGLVLLVAFTEGDNLDEIMWMVNKILHLRIFPDENKVMNLSVLDVKGSILSISQFTLYADSRKGNRPSYNRAMTSRKAEGLYEEFNQALRESVDVETGRFGANMDIDLTNAGPVTILLER